MKSPNAHILDALREQDGEDSAAHHAPENDREDFQAPH